MKLYKILALSFILMFSSSIFAQEIELNKDDFSSKDNYKLAKSYVKEGEALYSLGKGMYSQAIEFYLKAHNLYGNY